MLTISFCASLNERKNISQKDMFVLGSLKKFFSRSISIPLALIWSEVSEKKTKKNFYIEIQCPNITELSNWLEMKWTKF